MVPELGVIEGYFGRPWAHQDRKQVLTRLRELGYAWFHYAPKADAWLRRRWPERHPDAVLAELADLSAHCRGLGMRFGVGLSPYELYRDFSGDAKRAFVDKVRSLDAIGIDDLAILFDDTRGDVPDLAARESEIVHAAQAITRASRVLMCPTYYSDDRMLDVVFGQRPNGYLEDLGRRLEPTVRVYWTGEEICAREFSPGHLTRVADALRRKPTLWDNYPVNDGPRMSRFLHLRGVSGRPADDRRPRRGPCHQPGAAGAPEPDPGGDAGGQLPRRRWLCLPERVSRGRAQTGRRAAGHDAGRGPSCAAGPRLRRPGRFAR